MAESNGSGIIGVEVLAERISNVSKRLDEQVTAQKAAVDAALVASNQAIGAALATQEKAVSAAFLASEKALTAALQASEKAISKSEAAQSEVNKIIAGLQADVISLRESRSQTSGTGGGMEKMYGWIMAGIMFIATIGSLLYTAMHVRP